MWRWNSKSKILGKWAIILILLSATLVGFIARMSVSVALPSITQEFNWSSVQQGRLGGILLGIFLISYGFSNVFLSPWIDTLGAKVMLSAASLVTAISLLFAGAFGHIYYLFLFSRILLGLAQGVVFPSASKVTAQWFPMKKRAQANSVFLSGGPLGSFLSPLILTPLITSTSWEIAFYFVGILNFLVVLPILFLLDENKNQATKNPKNDKFTINHSIRELLAKKQFQVILVTFTVTLVIWWGLSLWLPTYLVDVKGFDLSEMKYGASFTYLGAALGMYAASWMSDVTGGRKTVIVSSLTLTTVLILSLTVLDIQSKTVGLLLLFTIFFVSTMPSPVFFTILQTKVPNSLIGSASGVMNGVGNGVGVIGPLSVGFVVSLTGSYNWGLILLGLIALTGGLLFKWLYHEEDIS